MINFFQKIIFMPINTDLCILVLRQNDEFTFIGVYIDNLMLKYQSHDRLNRLKNYLIKKFNKIYLGNVKKIVKEEIIQDFQAETF